MIVLHIVAASFWMEALLFAAATRAFAEEGNEELAGKGIFVTLLFAVTAFVLQVVA
jgi:hypothetical protein